jgi:flagellar biosynthesis chaperone FliJ
VAPFRYRLQTLLDRKVQAREEAQHALAAAQQDLRKEVDDLESCRREQEACAERLRQVRADWLATASGVSSGEAMRLRRVHIQRLEEECREAASETRAQELSVAEAEDRLAATRETLALRSRDVEVLEKHRARLERRFVDNAARKEALEQEEIATIVFLRGSTAT